MIRQTDTPGDSRRLGASLGPVLRETCEGRLGEITWFKADWQRGGAATGTALFTLDDGAEAEVVVKLPVVQRELLWLQRLQSENSSSVVPCLYAGGPTLGDYDLAWVIIERLPHGPLGAHWHPDHMKRIAEAAAEFQAECARYPVDDRKRVEPWADLVKEAQESVRINSLDHENRWRDAIKTLRHKLGGIVERWEARPVEWLHGDLHVANAMSRVGMDEGPVCLIDLAEVHAGHWVEDAVYLERQLWARPERLKAHKPVRAMAAARRARGLAADQSDAELAMIRRALLASTAPRFLKTEGDPRHLEACLRQLETALQTLR
ncbi:MAG: phosphotransferase family protein [Planctomycetota bacterium]